MTWFFLALATALFESFKDVVVKKSLSDIPPRVVAWCWVFFAMLFLLPVLLFTEPVSPGPHFWTALLLSGLLNFLAVNLYVNAINSSDLSLSVPMIALTPLFLLVTSPLILGEVPSMWGGFGVLLVVVGSYTLNIQQRHAGFLEPYRALLKQRGPRQMLAVAFIWSIAANIDKVGIQNSSPIFWVTSVNALLAVAMAPAMLRTKGVAVHLQQNLGHLMVIGLFVALSVACQMYAVQMALVPYVIAVKRTSTVMSIVWGHLIFKEVGLKERLTGGVIIMLGIFCISLL